MSQKVVALLLIALLTLAVVAVYEGQLAIQAVNVIGMLEKENEILRQEISGFNATIGAYKKTVEALRSIISNLNSTLLSYRARIVGLEGEIGRLRENLAQFQNKVVELTQKLENATLEKEELRQRLESLQDKYDNLTKRYEELEIRFSAFKEQTEEVLYYRMFRARNYRNNSTWYLYYRIPAEDYIRYRTDPGLHQPMTLENRLTPEVLVNATSSYDDPTIREMANDLHEISGGDQELLVNIALQVVHQLYYNHTLYAKYPLETLVESSGDCDNLAVLLASVLKAAGLDVALLIGTVEGSGHVMVGIALDGEPEDPAEYGRPHIWYVDYEGKRYYTAEPTWPPIGSLGFVDPASEAAMFRDGALVGDNPWGSKFEIEEVVPIP